MKSENSSGCPQCVAQSDQHTLCRVDDVAARVMREGAIEFSESRRRFLKQALAGGAAVALLPFMESRAEADMFMPSPADQARLGDQAAVKILQKYREVHDTRSQAFNDIGHRLVNALSPRDRGPWDYRFHVIESPDVNAFAVPGGNMFMFTGLMDKMRSNDELAAVTGHEMTHVRKQHWAKAAAAQSKRGLGLSVLLGLTHANSSFRQLAGLGDSLISLRFSRSEEDEADAGGLQDMVQANYDPNGMLDLFETLQSASHGGSGISFLSDHPLTSDRIRKTRQRIADMQR